MILLELFSQRNNHILHSLHQTRSIKTDRYQKNIIKMIKCSKKLVKYKEYSCFDYSDFPAHSMIRFDVCWGSLRINIFGNSSLAASNTPSRLPSRLSFRFLWLWSHFVIKLLCRTLNTKYVKKAWETELSYFVIKKSYLSFFSH